MKPCRDCALLLRKCCRMPHTEKGKKKLTCCTSCLWILGLLFVAAAIVVPIILNNMLDDALRSAAIIDSKDAVQYETWSGQGDKYRPLDVNLYVYDLQNPDDVLNGAAPIIKEVGPFYYQLTKKAFNVSWNADRTIMQYKQWQYYVFDRSRSVAGDDYNVTMVNMAFVGLRAVLTAPYYADFGPGIMHLLYYDYSDVQRIFTRRSVKEFFFGYVDPQLVIAHGFVPSIPEYYTGVLGNQTYFDNATAIAKFDAIYTGVDDRNKARIMYKYQDMTTLTACPDIPCPPHSTVPAWATEKDSVVRGSDGSTFYQNLKPEQTLSMFVSSFFRPLDLTFSKEFVLKGIDVLEYHFAPYETYNNAKYPSNSRWFQNGANGIFNVTNFLGNVPIYMSKPRFKDADASITDPLKITYVDNNVYDSYVHIEPRSGLSLNARISAQFNTYISPLPNMPTDGGVNTTTWFPNLKPALMPVFWVEEGGGLSDADAETFIEQVYGAQKLADLSKLLFSGLGGLSLLLGAAFSIWLYRHRHTDFTKLATDEHARREEEKKQQQEREGGGEATTHQADNHAHYVPEEEVEAKQTNATDRKPTTPAAKKRDEKSPLVIDSPRTPRDLEAGAPPFTPGPYTPVGLDNLHDHNSNQM